MVVWWLLVQWSEHWQHKSVTLGSILSNYQFFSHFSFLSHNICVACCFYTASHPQPSLSHTHTHTHTLTAGVIIVRKETYPYPPDIPEGRWAVYEVTLPNRPTDPVTISYHTLTNTITLSHDSMTFDPDGWNVPQDLTVFAVEDNVNRCRQ